MDLNEPPLPGDQPAEGDEPVSLYAQLQVSPTASPAVISAAYQVLSRTEGADQGLLSAAYEVLRNPRRRARYDLGLLGEGTPAPADVPVRARTCWRCTVPLTAAKTYCSVCHWTRCVQCQACGCQNPDWLRTRPVRLVWWPAATLLAILALVLVVGAGLTLQPAAAALPEALGTLACGMVSSAPAAPASRPPGTPSNEPGHLAPMDPPSSAPAPPAAPPLRQGLASVFLAVANALRGGGS
jgi:hypothetical protein